MTRKKTIKLYDPEGEVLDPEPLVVAESTGFLSWTPEQWALFFVAFATFIATVVNIVTGNPVGLPLAG